MGRRDFESPPLRGRGSPRRRSPAPSRREHSHKEKRSPKRKRSRSPISSPVREKPSSRARSPIRRKSISPETRSPVRGRPSTRGSSPKRRRSMTPVSLSPEMRKTSSHARSPKHTNSRSPGHRSPSPRTKRLLRAKADLVTERGNEREAGKSHRRRSDRAPDEEKGVDKELPSDRKERRSGRDDIDNERKERRSGRDDIDNEQKERRSGRDDIDNEQKERRSGRVDIDNERKERRSGGDDIDNERKERRSGRDDIDNERKEKRSTRDDIDNEQKEKRSGRDDIDNGRKERRAGRDDIDNGRKERRSGRDDIDNGRKERRSGRDDIDNGSSRSRRSTSPSDHHRHTGRHRSRSPAAADNRARDEVAHSRGADHRNGGDDSVAKMKAAESALEAKEKQKPSFELSGKLAAETNRVAGVTLLFNEPPDARKPAIRWRLYIFKNGEVLNDPLYIHRQSCFLFGRERKVADVPTDHPSCSKQHAVIQYRQVEKENPDGTTSKQVRPYAMDLGSTNGTFINENRIEPQRYYELFEKDTIKFGNSSREYVLLHENSAG